jgi:hypothetical protein
MLEKTIILIVTYGTALYFDGPKLKKISRREQIVYGGLILFSLYLCVNYLFFTNLPNPTDVFTILFEKPSKMIIDYFKTSS